MRKWKFFISWKQFYGVQVSFFCLLIHGCAVCVCVLYQVHEGDCRHQLPTWIDNHRYTLSCFMCTQWFLDFNFLYQCLAVGFYSYWELYNVFKPLLNCIFILSQDFYFSPTNWLTVGPLKLQSNEIQSEKFSASLHSNWNRKNNKKSEKERSWISFVFFSYFFLLFTPSHIQPTHRPTCCCFFNEKK